MALSDKQRRFLKKTRQFILRFCGWLLLLGLPSPARNFLCHAQDLLYGPVSYLGAQSVYFAEEFDYFYTNPMGMFRHCFWILLLIYAAILSVSALSCGLLTRIKRLQKLKAVDRFLLAALGFAAVALIGFSAYDSWAESTAENFFSQAKKCRSVHDYEVLCGRSVFHETVAAGDEKFIAALAMFQNSGFAPGRELYIFWNKLPAVYLLIWLEDGKIVHRDWCFRDTSVEQAAQISKKDPK